VNAQGKADLAAFQEALARLEATECWSVVAGSTTGSIISLDFGKKIPRARKLRNQDLTEEQRNFESEFVLFVECVWRLDGRDAVLCGAWDDNGPEGPMLRGLKLLEGSLVEKVDLREPGLDLHIQFRGGVNLWIFCDQVSEVEQYDNYVFFSPETNFTVTWKSRLKLEVSQRSKVRAVPEPE